MRKKIHTPKLRNAAYETNAQAQNALLPQREDEKLEDDRLCPIKRHADSPSTMKSLGSVNGAISTPGTTSSAASWSLNSYIVTLIEYRNRRQVFDIFISVINEF
jgi:hypothetical protein